eukprot:CAMPEP_0170553074 /NCGR_PEP_ID=MMETSP0211-20121228/10929_1 /TAXON_ID=311385 /ORGANISM="Pseudokeronopsis sp., Strain OXSARD2" /LENGTH=66 /DNA_ID=CAMNT_0010861201 /DNA_START=540 /DNA_END=740 /DNA_ORIENTATION=-
MMARMNNEMNLPASLSNDNNLNSRSKRILDMILDADMGDNQRLTSQTDSLKSSLLSHQPPLSINSL